MIRGIIIFAIFAAARQVEPPLQVSALVAPVVNAHTAVTNKDDENTEASLDLALQNVLETKTGFGDEALAILLGYYVGEAAAEDVSCELVARGDHVLFYINKYANSDVAVRGVRGPHLRHFGQYDIVRKRIESGEVCEVEK